MRRNDTVDDYDRACLRGFILGFIVIPIVTGAIVVSLASLLSLCNR